MSDLVMVALSSRPRWRIGQVFRAFAAIPGSMLSNRINFVNPLRNETNIRKPVGAYNDRSSERGGEEEEEEGEGGGEWNDTALAGYLSILNSRNWWSYKRSEIRNFGIAA